METQAPYIKLWDVSGGYLSQDDSEVVGALGLDKEGMLYVVASETEPADETLEQVCERVNGMRTFHVRKVASDGSVLTSEAYVYTRADAGFVEALEYYLQNYEFLILRPFEGEI